MININEIIKYSQKLKLLYVEDNKQTRESTLLVLENFFDNIIIGVDGKDGLEKFKNNPDIDIVISDINMPIMNGLDMSKDILAIDPNMYIFIFSAHNEVNYFMDAIKIGIEGYLLKPIDMDQFIQSLGKCIEKINLKKENLEYKNHLENKVQTQVNQLRQKDKLLIQSSKMAAMGEMIDIIAHQWIQPLNIISMRADYLSSLIKDEIDISDDDIIECNNGVQQQVKHLLNTLNEFRGFFRPVTSIEAIDLKELFDGLQLLLKDNLIGNEIELIYNCQNIKFDANINEFKHIFINLINNAKDAFIQNNIKNRKLIVEATESTNNIMITFKDNAGGISDEVINDIFKQNFTTKEDSGGTGIGLYMAKTIIEKNMGGTLSVVNDEDGAVFSIKLSI